METNKLSVLEFWNYFSQTQPLNVALVFMGVQPNMEQFSKTILLNKQFYNVFLLWTHENDVMRYINVRGNSIKCLEWHFSRYLTQIKYKRNSRMVRLGAIADENVLGRKIHTEARQGISFLLQKENFSLISTRKHRTSCLIVVPIVVTTPRKSAVTTTSCSSFTIIVSLSASCVNKKVLLNWKSCYVFEVLLFNLLIYW